MKHNEKITIGKNTEDERKIPQRYIPKSLSPQDKKKQEDMRKDIEKEFDESW